MIYAYGVTQQGSYHVEKNLPCQDYHYYKLIEPNYAIGAVADGLGSQKFTDVASKIAATDAVEFCKEKIDLKDPEGILTVIKQAFSHALEEIKKEADSKGNDVNEYDTTLALAVFVDDKIYYGNSGDSGIIVHSNDGTFKGVTIQQRDENGCVFPLCFGEEHWQFGKEEGVASCLLATDGMLEIFYPYLLKGEKVEIYIALANYMMSNTVLNYPDTPSEEVQKAMDNFVAGLSPDQVSDDKTVLALINDSVEVNRQDEDYYKAPDWAELKKKKDEEYKRKAYPHLYKDENQE